VFDSVEWDKRDHARCALCFGQSTLPPTGMDTIRDSRNNHSESFGMREFVDRLPGCQPELPAQRHPPPKPIYVFFMAHNVVVSTLMRSCSLRGNPLLDFFLSFMDFQDPTCCLD